MLVVKRKKGESIVIGDNIEISIVEVDGGSVKIAIDAPRDVTILRKELIMQVEEENKKAVRLNLEVLKSLKK
ncbi:carbon storage regulator CsrA [Haloimpatiens sp. FM7315]|uniref:carbon storage regulator CsrA n=1 Tax=Haloimpatiens sp. FM7315 TaxID=3298609 RepID=UPI00370C1E39